MNTLPNKTFFRFLSKNKLYSAINIFGYAVSLAFVILIADFTVRQLTTDNIHQDKERIFLLGNESSMGTGYYIGERMKSRYPEIEDYCRVVLQNLSSVPVEVEGKKLVATLMCADTSFFDMFAFKLLSGDPGQVLASKENVIITESYARILFGNRNPIGQQITFTGEKTVNEKDEDVSIQVTRTVSGVIEDISNSVFPDKIQIITNIDNVRSYNPAITAPGMNSAGDVILFLKLYPGSELMSKLPEIRQYFTEFFWTYSSGAWKDVTLTPFEDAFFINLHGAGLLQGNKSFVYILLTIGLAILLFAVINYINLTVAQSALRAKEMATRRLLGANRGEIIRRFISESVIICLLSFMIAYVLALAVGPWASSLLQYPVDIIHSLSFGRAFCYLAAVLLLGIISGVVPAVIITRYKPVDVVRGSFNKKSRMVFSRVFIVVQNVITIALIACCITIYRQINHLINAPLGYDYQNVLDISTTGFADNTQISAFRNEVSRLSGVECLCLSCGTPLDRGNNSTISIGSEKVISFQSLYADSLYLKIFGLEKLRENHSTAAPSFYLNELAVKELGLDEDAPYFKGGSDYGMTFNVAGIYKDFHIGSIIQESSPMLMYITGDLINDPARAFRPWNILVKVSENADRKVLFESINQCFRDVTGHEYMQAEYMEDQLKNQFSQQRNLATIVLVFTFMAVFIGALGLLAISTYFIRQRRREIAVRKVFGAERHEILSQLISVFLRYVYIAFAFAIPLIWIVMDWWLEDYSYHITLSVWTFLAAGLFTLIVSAFTVMWQSIQASAVNPAEAVKQ